MCIRNQYYGFGISFFFFLNVVNVITYAQYIFSAGSLLFLFRDGTFEIKRKSSFMSRKTHTLRLWFSLAFSFFHCSIHFIRFIHYSYYALSIHLIFASSSSIPLYNIYIINLFTQRCLARTMCILFSEEVRSKRYNFLAILML